MRLSSFREGSIIGRHMSTSLQEMYGSMRRLSSGERITNPGDAPADYGISETLRYQIQNSQEAARNLEKATSLINSADAWLQTTNDILSRMKELAISSSDASKSDSDRESLNIEYQQLKEEVGRISREARYNGVQVAGRDQLLAYDADKETFVFSQLDGRESYDLNVKVLSGLKAANSADFFFDPSKGFTQSYDGKYIYYVDSNDSLVRYDIHEGEIVRDSSDSEDKGLEVDELGRLWYATETSTGSGAYSLRQHDFSSWVQDTSSISNTSITDMASKEFSVFQDRVYYVNTSGELVSRGIQDVNDMEVELDSTDFSFSTTDGQFAISEDGLFIADMTSSTTVRVTNVETQNSNSYTLESGITVSSLAFSADNRELAFVDSAEGNIHRIEMEAGDQPILSSGEILHYASGGSGFTGLNLDGGSHRAHFRVHSGPDAVHESFLTMGDVRLNALGLSRTRVDSAEAAGKALQDVHEAINRVTIQRSRLGGEASRIEKTYYSLLNYSDEVGVADSVIRDVDIAAETARMTDEQVRYQMTIALMAQANQQPEALISLLQR